VFVNSSKSKSPDASVPESCHSKSDDEQEEILGSDDDEQESPQDYCKGTNSLVHVLMKKMKGQRCLLNV